jgi:GTP-binding protein
MDRFSVFPDDSEPFSGTNGTAVRFCKLNNRPTRTMKANVAIFEDSVNVTGRGDLHPIILIEEMRRNGIETCISSDEGITLRDNFGNVFEPFGHLHTMFTTNSGELNFIAGAAILGASDRKNSGTDAIRIAFEISIRGLLGCRNEV